MPKLQFEEDSVGEMCRIALKLAARLCSGNEALLLDNEHTMVSIPEDTIKNVKEKAGNPGTVEEIMNYLKYDPWAIRWAEGLCEATAGTDDEHLFSACKERLLRKLAERIREVIITNEQG